MTWMVDLDAGDERSYDEQAADIFARVLGTFLTRIAPNRDGGIARLVAAYNAFSQAGEDLKESQVREYLKSERLPHPDRIFQIGEALGSRDAHINPEGCDCDDASGLLMLLMAGKFENVVILLDQAFRESAFDISSLASYLVDANFRAQLPDSEDFALNAAPIGHELRLRLISAWQNRPTKVRFERYNPGALFARPWHAATHPDYKFARRTAYFHDMLQEALTGTNRVE